MYISMYRYKEILITLVKSILEKIQFHYNGLELGNIDDDTINEVIIAISRFDCNDKICFIE